jgi:hypothetical protein
MRLLALLLLALLTLPAESRRRSFTPAGRASTGRGIQIVGNGLASLARTIKDGGADSEEKLIAGKDVDEPASTFKMHA